MQASRFPPVKFSCARRTAPALTGFLSRSPSALTAAMPPCCTPVTGRNRLADARQTYFLGLVFSGDGTHLYASLGSITDPTGSKPGSTGNAIAVYSFQSGDLKPERLIKIPPQPLADGK